MSDTTASKALKKLKSMDKSQFLYIFGWLVIIGIVFWGIYSSYSLSKRQTSQCKVFDNLYTTINGNIRSLNKLDPQCGYLFRDYYIKTAYNACSIGNYTNDYVNTCTIPDLLKQGVRGYDFEIFSIDDQPVVATSNTDDYYVKQTLNYIGFNDVMQIFQNYAFRYANAPNYNDPIIIHIRFKSNNLLMYQNLAKILVQYVNILLGKEYSYEYHSQYLGAVPILNFLGKIVIIVDMNNQTFLECKEFYEYVNMTSNSLYMRALQYYDVAYSPNIEELTTYNKTAMTIAMPDSGSNPPNPSSALVRACGCQLIAMRYQLFDTLLEENELFFDQNSYAFVLKPEILRYIPDEITIPEEPDPAVDYAPRTISAKYYSFQM